MKNIKVWVDEDSPPKDSRWIHIKNFFDFANLLDTVDFSGIDLISFGTDLEYDDNRLGEDLNATDCAIHLIERAKGKEIPQCFNHTNNRELQQTINHYAASYKYDKYCGKIQV